MSLMSKQEIIKSKNGYDIHFVITEPMDTEIHPCMILLHGTCSDKNEVGNAYVYLANQLANNGYKVIRFDFIGSGDSDVDYVHYSMEYAVNDTHDVIDYALNVGCKEIGLIGWSQGGTLTLLASNSHVSKVITLAGALDYTNLATQSMLLEAKENGYAIYDPGFKAPVKFSLKWINEALNTDFLDIYSKKNLPTLAIHGLEDDVVDPKCAKAIVDASNHVDSKVVYLKDCDHTFNTLTHEYQYFKLVSDEIIDWLKNTRS